jgi:hypothetical protein
MKVMYYALASKFGTESVDKIMEVIGATQNPEMATEILLGIYEQPKIPNAVVNSQGLVKTAVNIDYWCHKVTYSYEEETRQHMYVDKDTDTSLITLDNYQEYQRDYGSDNITSFYLPTGQMTIRKDSCDFSDWLSQDELVVG